MRIEQIIIDGFKSYSARTVIGDFDPSFNAITGLNGSGKSNILDAICFVLGISTMSIVRAQNLQDLIYKRGQAGVTKASVSIVFDNRDPGGPIGFEDSPQITVTRQIVMGGTSKYHINGHRAQQQTLLNMFQSVQLNINNPNFLIMQGKITKVLNMKPVEILALIEEAAGTRMFEERKAKAFQTMAKKDAKVNEINAILGEEVEPKLTRLREEKKAFLEFQFYQSEVERLTKLCVSFDYVNAVRKFQESRKLIENKKMDLETIFSRKTELERELENIDSELKTVKLRKDEDMKKGGIISKMENELSQIENELARLATASELKRNNIEEERIQASKHTENTSQIEAAIARQKKAREQKEDTAERLRQEFEREERRRNQLEELLDNLTSGVATRVGGKDGFVNKATQTKKKLHEIENELNDKELRSKEIEKELQETKSKISKAETRRQEMESGIESMRLALESERAKMQSKDLYKKEIEQKQAEKANIESEIASLKKQVDDLNVNESMIDFKYSDPRPGFDRKLVKGTVASLFNVREDCEEKALALEIAAGGRLFNVVVENEQIGSELLKHGNFRRRVTLLPLNKITPYVPDSEKMRAAKQVSPGKVSMAVECLDFSSDVTKAIQFAFGATAICADDETAKAVTFNKSIGLRSVTYDGDVYDASGTLSGGSTTSTSGLLTRLRKYNMLKKRIDEFKQYLYASDNQISSLKTKIKESQEQVRQLTLAEHKMKTSIDFLNKSAEVRLLEETKQKQDLLVELRKSIEFLRYEAAMMREDIKTFEQGLSDSSENKENKIADLEKKLNDCNGVLNKKSQAFDKASEDFSTANFELEKLQSEIEEEKAAQKECMASIEKLEKELVEICERTALLHSKQQQKRFSLNEEMTALNAFNEEIKGLEKQRKTKISSINDIKLKLQSCNHDLKEHEKDLERLKLAKEQLINDHEWIEEQESEFGKKGSAFDYDGVNISSCKDELKRLTATYNQMKKSVNDKVLNMIDGVEKKENDLSTMVRQIYKDRRNIEDTIMSLENYKREALERTWRAVDDDFGKIFGDLLPGNSAKLVPLKTEHSDDDIVGLSISVRIGEIWKESLNELSGGQRSLVAISLILSLLRYKPAPMYILDEVDAALDLSHTQNIGQIIKNKFKGSQFIVVSLKEGMFTNANKIFQTRFVEGKSTVRVLS